MSARRALPVDLDVTPLAPLAANAAARRALDSQIPLSDAPRRALELTVGPRRAAGSNPDAALTGAARRAEVSPLDAQVSTARRALPTSAVGVVGPIGPARSLDAPARALRADFSAHDERISCAPRRALDLDEFTTTLPLTIDPAAFVEKPRRVKKFAAGLAAAVLLGALGSQLAGLTNSSSLLASQLAAPAAAANVDGAVRADEQVSRDGQRPELTDSDLQQELADIDATVAQEAREVKAEQAAKAAEEARVKAEAEAKAAKQAAVTGQIAPGQKVPLSVDEALANAQRLSGSPNYHNMCLALVSNFYGYTSSGAIGAQQAANEIIAAGQMHYDMSDIPVGALIWYDGTPVGNPYGHVAMYAGDGLVYSNGHQNGVGLMSIHKPSDEWRQPIIGWSNVWLPAATR